MKTASVNPLQASHSRDGLFRRSAVSLASPGLQDRLRRALVILEGLLAVGAVAGGLLLVLRASTGKGPMSFDVEWLDGSPFASYFLPGLFLAALGFVACLAAVLHARRSGIAPYISFVVGCLMMVFEAVEVALIPFTFLQPLYFVVGLAIASLALPLDRSPHNLSRFAGSAFARVDWRLALVAGLCLVALYAVAIRPWLLDWGSTAAERQARMPGEELMSDPTWRVTRAVTIDAPPSVVWAWLIQHGQDRAGFYSYDWLENLTGANIHNVDQLHPEWQTREPGDGIPMARPFFGSRAGFTVLTVSKVEAGRLLVTTSASGDVAVRQLAPTADGGTRLIFRDLEGTGNAGLLDRAYRWLFWEPTHFVMQHGMLMGIKSRAEARLHDPGLLYQSARAGWIAATFATAGWLLTNRRHWPWLSLPILATLPAILLTRDLNAAMAAFIAVGLTTAGAIQWGRRWWPGLVLMGYFVLLFLVLAADAYVGFGLLFAVALLVCGATWMALPPRPEADPAAA